jgi:carboxyl-terminal processing protease
VIKEVTPGGPSQKGGLRPGDEIVTVNGLPAGSEAGKLDELLHSEQIEVTVYRPAARAVIQATLQLEEFVPEASLGVVRRNDNAWDYWLDPARKIAYLRLSAIEPDSSQQVIDVVDKLQKSGLRGLVLDLRWCPGGTLDDARVIAEAFLGDYSLPFFMLPIPGNFAALADACLDNHCNNAVVRYRPDPRTHESRADIWTKRAPQTFPRFPMVALTNGETTGGAELIAAVLQDNKRAFILGQRTRGKGSVQSFVELGDGGRVTIAIANTRLKITNGLLVRPSGKNLHRFPDCKPADDWGVRPDPGLEFRVSPDLTVKLHEWIELMSLRPGWSNEALSLDDPDADPQRLAALRLLQRIVH